MIVLWQLLTTFGLLSLCAVGGINAVIPEMVRQVVTVHHWLSDADFVALFALAQAAPGPNLLIASLIGQHVAGLPGALVATIAACGPSSVLAYQVGKLWHRFRDAKLRHAMQLGLAPISIGLLLGSGYLLARHASHDVLGYAITGLTTLLVVKTRLNPLWLISMGALVGWLDWM